MSVEIPTFTDYQVDRSMTLARVIRNAQQLRKLRAEHNNNPIGIEGHNENGEALELTVTDWAEHCYKKMIFSLVLDLMYSEEGQEGEEVSELGYETSHDILLKCDVPQYLNERKTA